MLRTSRRKAITFAYRSSEKKRRTLLLSEESNQRTDKKRDRVHCKEFNRVCVKLDKANNNHYTNDIDSISREATKHGYNDIIMNYLPKIRDICQMAATYDGYPVLSKTLIEEGADELNYIAIGAARNGYDSGQDSETIGR